MVTSRPPLSRFDTFLKGLRGAFLGAVLTFRVTFAPSPAARPRINPRGGVFYPKGYALWLAACHRQFAEQAHGAPLEGPLLVGVEIAVERPRTSKLVIPRGDMDNFAKGPLDGATKAGLWSDDSQIVGMVAGKRWTEPGEEPGATLYVSQLVG